MKFFPPAGLVFLGLTLLLGGCASFDAAVDPGRSLASLQRYFVVTNPNDNHAIDRQIVDALKARGLEAELGPLTMMPDHNQAIVTYQDHWAWDFGDHLSYLKIAVHDTRSNQPFATVTFSAKVPGSQSVSEIVNRLVDRLFAKASSGRP